MFSLSQRVQTVANYSVTVLIFIASFVIATFLQQLYQNDAFSLPCVITNVVEQKAVRNSRKFGASNGKGKENIKILFDLETDLTPLFNWNTKQVFVYLTAEYEPTEKGVRSEVTFWDKIVTKPGKINLKKAKAKYSVWDVKGNATYNLKWNIQPWVGPLISGSTVVELNDLL